MKLRDKVVIVTGGANGIGRAICLRFAEEGARVVVADIDESLAGEVADSLPGEAMALHMDVSSREQVRAGVEKVVEQMGKLDILVNNAGIVTFASFEECSEELWDKTIATNLKGTFLCSQAAIPHLKQSRGTIINLTSVAAKTGGVAAAPPYGASKAGISALTLNLAGEMASHGVRVNGIAPGVIDTNMTNSPAHDKVKQSIPLGKAGTPEDVAACALFLASEDARHITGEIIDVNGGLLMD